MKTKENSWDFRKLTKPDNEQIRESENIYRLKNKGVYQSIGNVAVSTDEDFFEKLTQPTRKIKSNFLQRVHKKVARENKAYCCDSGLFNPIKLNISNDTLTVLKGGTNEKN